MSQIISNFICGLITSIGIYVISANLLDKKIELKNPKNIFILLSTMCLMLNWKEDYEPIVTILMLIESVVLLKYYFNISINISIILSGVSIIFFFLAEFVMFAIPATYLNAEIIRNNAILFIASNIAITLIAIGISKIKFVRNKISKFIDRQREESEYLKIIFISLLVTILSILTYELLISKYFNNTYYLMFFIIAVFLALSYIYINEKNERIELDKRYGSLLEYSCTFEEWIEQEGLNRHEYKNQLSVLKDLCHSRKAKEYIDDILDLNNLSNDENKISGINYLPNGGIKGLLYYKSVLLTKNKINYMIDISKNIKPEDFNLNISDIRVLTQMLGIFIDNAMEECMKNEDSNLAIEIYKINNKINIVVSNTLDKNTILNIDKIAKKGYTSKGKGRGYGLHYVKRLLNQSNKFINESDIINETFIQKIIIN